MLTAEMGIELSLYRLKIGSHYWRLCPKRIRSNRVGNRTKEAWECTSFEIFHPPPDECHQIPPLSLRATKASVLVVAVHLSLLLTCVTKPHSAKNLHDLSARLMIAGDISPNPGPIPGYVWQSALPGSVTDEYWNGTPSHPPDQAIQSYPHYHAGIAIRSLQNDVLHLQNWVKWLYDQQARMWMTMQDREQQWQAYCNDLVRQNSELQFECGRMSEQTGKAANEMYMTQSHLHEIKNTGNVNEETSVRMFGVAEADFESYGQCLHTVFDILSDVMPEVSWKEGDIVRVQRLGSRNVSRENVSRPVVVTFRNLSLKLFVLRRGRPALRRLGVRVSGDVAGCWDRQDPEASDKNFQQQVDDRSHKTDRHKERRIIAEGWRQNDRRQKGNKGGRHPRRKQKSQMPKAYNLRTLREIPTDDWPPLQPRSDSADRSSVGPGSGRFEAHAPSSLTPPVRSSPCLQVDSSDDSHTCHLLLPSDEPSDRIPPKTPPRADRTTTSPKNTAQPARQNRAREGASKLGKRGCGAQSSVLEWLNSEGSVASSANCEKGGTQEEARPNDVDGIMEPETNGSVSCSPQNLADGVPGDPASYSDTQSQRNVWHGRLRHVTEPGPSRNSASDFFEDTEPS